MGSKAETGADGSGLRQSGESIQVLRSVLGGLDMGALAAILDGSSAIIVITDPSGKIEYVNSGFAEATGYSLEEVRGCNVRLLKGGNLSPEYYRKIWETITAGREWHGDFLNRRKSGEEYWESASILPLFDRTGALLHFVSVKQDVTTRKRRETVSSENEKMRAMGALAGGLAHTLNNLLTVIVGYADLLMENLTGDKREQVQEILTAGSRAAAMTNDLLSFSGRQTVQPHAVYLNRLVPGMRSRLVKALGPENTFRLALGRRVAPVCIDPERMRQVLAELAANARDAMPSGGVFTIRTANVKHLDQDPADAVRRGPFVELTVSDNGSGMDEDVRRRLFEPFFTTRGPSRAGLGLSRVFGIIRQAGGIVRATGQPGQGAEFRIYLPAAKH